MTHPEAHPVDLVARPRSVISCKVYLGIAGQRPNLVRRSRAGSPARTLPQAGDRTFGHAINNGLS
jgi:hypothetical protein